MTPLKPVLINTTVIPNMIATKKCPVCGSALNIKRLTKQPKSPETITCPIHGLIVSDTGRFSAKPSIKSDFLTLVKKTLGVEIIGNSTLTLPPPTTRPEKQELMADKTLRKGDTGTSVTMLKYQLGIIGFPVGNMMFYDELTEEAVKKAQSLLKLPVTGIADSVTRKRIREESKKKAGKIEKTEIKKVEKQPDTLFEMWLMRKKRRDNYDQ